MKRTFAQRFLSLFTRNARSGGSVVPDKGKHYDQLLVQRAKGAGVPSFRQFMYIGRVLTPTDRIILAVSGVIAFGAFAFIGVDTWKNHVVVVPGQGGAYTETLLGTPRFLNPLLAPLSETDADISRLIFSGLFKRDAHMKLVPDLAQSYDISEDKKVYTFHLRDGVTWHDGKPFTARDVVYTITAAKDRNIGSPLASVFAGVTPLRVDDATVTLTLDAPYAPLLDALTLGILPEHIWSSIPPAAFPYAEYNLKKPIGTGPYRVEKYTYDQKGQVLEYRLTRNTSFYDRAPHIDSVTFTFTQDVMAAVEALNGKQTMGLGYVPHALKQQILVPGMNFLDFALPRYRATFFNLQSSGAVSDIAVRTALARATNKQQLVRDTVNGSGVIVNGPILPGFLGYSATLATVYEDTDEAMAALEAAGWKIPEGGTVREKTVNVKVGKKTEKQQRQLSFTITTIDRPEFVAAAEALKQQWMRIGAAVTVQAVPSETIARDVIRPRAFDVLLYDIVLSGDPDPFAFWHSSQAQESGLNLSGYANKDVDLMLEQARTTIDPEQRAKLYRDFQNLLVQDVPAIFLLSPLYTYAMSGTVKGVEPDRMITTSDRFANIVNWYIKTQHAWK